MWCVRNNYDTTTWEVATLVVKHASFYPQYQGRWSLSCLKIMSYHQWLWIRGIEYCFKRSPCLGKYNNQLMKQVWWRRMDNMRATHILAYASTMLPWRFCKPDGSVQNILNNSHTVSEQKNVEKFIDTSSVLYRCPASQLLTLMVSRCNQAWHGLLHVDFLPKAS